MKKLILALLILWGGTLRAAPQVHQTAQRPYTAQVTDAITVQWAASTSSNVLYRVYRATAQVGPYAVISNNLNALFYVDRPGTNGAVSGATYFYQVTAVDQTTLLESLPAATQSGTNFVSATMP